jgi:hypothetical protein
MASRQEEAARQTEFVGKQMDLGRQTSSTPPQRSPQPFYLASQRIACRLATSNQEQYSQGIFLGE